MYLLRLFPIRLRLLAANLLLVAIVFGFVYRVVPEAERPLYYQLLLFAMVASSLLALAVSRSVTAPLAALKKKLQEIKDTDRDHVIRDRASDEVGTLYRVVNEYVLYRDNEAMARQKESASTVEKSQEMASRSREMGHLGLLVEFGKLLSLNYDFGDAAHEVLSKVNVHLQLEWSSVMVWDESAQGMRLAATVGLDPKLTGEVKSGNRPQVQFKRGEGVSGEVFSTGEPLILNKGYKDKRFKHFPKYTCSSRRINTMACVPLAVDGIVLGVANFVNIQSPPVFTEEHVIFLARISEVLSFLLAKSTRFDTVFLESVSGLYQPPYFKYLVSLEGERVKRRPHAVSLVKLAVVFADKAREAQLKDQVHRKIGELIRKSFRKVDMATREENRFAICLPGTDSLGALFTAGRLKEQIDLFSFDEKDRQVFTTFGGLASFPEPVADWAALGPAVDAALAEAGRIGDSRVVCHRSETDGVAASSAPAAAEG
ncbi:MAG: GAF domain-containing protein [Candidatus Riflebacteria bacterium]|nr:GAF domain-containing protein [Candidatus Riflebacteria bacterium]